MRTDTSSPPGTVHIGTTPAEIVVGGAHRFRRRSLTIQNTTSDVTIYIGYGPGLTALNGLRLLPGQTLTETHFTGPVCAMASAPCDVPVVEIGFV